MLTLEQQYSIDDRVSIHDGHLYITCCLSKERQHLLMANIGTLVGLLGDKSALEFTCQTCSTQYLLPAEYIMATYQAAISSLENNPSTANL